MRGATGSDPRGGNFLDRRLAHRGQCRSVALLPRVGVPMTDDDRFRLLFGPYRTPVFRYGDDAFCELRGDVILCGLTDAPIPWPTGKRKLRGSRARSIVFCGEPTMRRTHTGAIVAAALTGCLLAGLAPAHGADWPMFGRDGTRNAVSPEKGPPLAWQTEERDNGFLLRP